MRSLLLMYLAASALYFGVHGVHGFLRRTSLDNPTTILRQQGLPAANGTTSHGRPLHPQARHLVGGPSPAAHAQNHAGNGRPTEFLAP
jgi:hypothetical protein